MQVKDAERSDADMGDDIRSYTKDIVASNSVDKECIQQMQVTSSGMVSMNKQMQ